MRYDATFRLRPRLILHQPRCDMHIFVYVHVYVYISAGPVGAHGCAALLCSPGILAISSSCSVLVPLLSRHPAISVCSCGLRFCFLGSLVLSSLFSVVLLKAVRATDASSYAQESGCLKLFGFGRLSPQSLIPPKPL